MGLATAFANAVSGLAASSRRADLIASNIANAMTEGYARRDVQLSARSTGGGTNGVTTSPVFRQQDRFLLAEQRIATAEAAGAARRQGFYAELEALLGTDAGAASLSSGIDALEAALTEAASRPDSTSRLNVVFEAAVQLTGALNAAGDWLQQQRSRADAEISAQIRSLNTALRQVDDLNVEIRARQTASLDVTGLEEQRQRVIDGIAELVPLREVMREGNQVALYTLAGAVLLEGLPMTLGFTPATAGVVTAGMSLAAGDLSGLTLNGQSLNTGDDGLFAGGTLAAAFALRDELAPRAQEQVDAVARSLIERMAGGADPTLAAGAPGLFTDAGAAFDVTAETGLAGRIAVNALVDPGQGGALWHLRAGLGASDPGDVGEAGLLNALSAALARLELPASGGLGTGARSASGLAAEVVSAVAVTRLSADNRAGFDAARLSSVSQALAGKGVDTDAELQDMLLVEQSYAANARVISALDEMLQQILQI